MSYTKAYNKKKEEILEQRNKILKNKGYDFEKEKALKDQIKILTEKISYISINGENIRKNKALAEELENLPAYIKEKERLTEEDKEKKKKEVTALNKENNSLAEDESAKQKLKNSCDAITTDIDNFNAELPFFCLRCKFNEEEIRNKINNADTQFVFDVENKNLKDTLTYWEGLLNCQIKELNILMREELNLKNLLSPEDNFKFSFGTNDTFCSDDDYLRIARTITTKVKINENSPDTYCSVWSSNWKELLRNIVALYRNVQIKEKIEMEIQDMQRYIKSHNKTHSISDIKFQVVDDPEIEILQIAKEIDHFHKKLDIDPFTVETSEIASNELFTEKLSDIHTKEIIELLNKFSTAIKNYPQDEIPAEDFFKIMTYATETENGKVHGPLYDIKNFGSSGTTTTFKMLLAMSFVSNTIRKGKDTGNRYLIIMDENGTIDETNCEAIKSMADSSGFILVTAQPTSTADGFNIYTLSVENQNRKVTLVSNYYK